MVSIKLPGIENEDILLSIFSFLPILDLARCAAVCKQWHEVVMGSTQIWKGKRYSSELCRRISAEMRTVLFSLPLLDKAEVQVGPRCCVNFSYPCLSLIVSSISGLRAVRDWQKVRCTYLSIEIDIAEFFFSSHSPIDFSVLEKLNITDSVATFTKPGTRAVCVISCAMQLCPNLRELSIWVDPLSADYLDALEGMNHLRTLKIRSISLESLVFLRHCSEVLEELELIDCFNMPSAAYAELRCLENLQSLQLYMCSIEEGDLEVAAQGLTSLMSLRLDNCYITDVSFMRHCGRLREVNIVVVGGLMHTSRLPTGLGHLPTSVRSLSLTADELSLPYLPYLHQLSLSCEQLDRLDFLCGCPQLRRLCLKYSNCPDESQLLNLRHLSQLETLEMPGRRNDMAVVSTVIPSLLQLDTLSVGYEDNVDCVLQDFPRIRSLSLFDYDGNLCDVSQLGKFGFSIYRFKYVCKFFHKVF